MTMIPFWWQRKADTHDINMNESDSGLIDKLLENELSIVTSGIHNEFQKRKLEDVDYWRQRSGWYDDDQSMTQYNNGVYETYMVENDGSNSDSKSGGNGRGTVAKVFMGLGAFLGLVILVMLAKSAIGGMSSTKEIKSDKRSSSRSRSKSRSCRSSSRAKSRSRRSKSKGPNDSDYDLMEDGKSRSSRRTSRSRSKSRRGRSKSKSRRVEKREERGLV